MTCHISFTKLSERTTPPGSSTSSVPHAEYAGANIINLPRRSTSSPPPTGRTPPFFIPSREPWSDDRELAARVFLFLVFGPPLVFFGALYLLFAS